jgi:hypothetical protein
MPSLVEQIDSRSFVAVLSTTARLLVEAKFELGALIYRHHIGALVEICKLESLGTITSTVQAFDYGVCERKKLTAWSTTGNK